MRSIEELRREQATLLRAYREAEAPAQSLAAVPRPGNLAACATYGRIADIVTVDPVQGAHLRVARQVWSGMPPVVADADGPEVRCYPTPGRIVSDYAVGDYVRIVATHGAMVAEPA